MNTIRMMLFDLDGTLLDTLEDIANAGNHAMRELGQPEHLIEDYKRMVGEGADVLVRRALPGDQQHLANDALAIFKAFYDAHPLDTTRPYEGIPELLDALSERGVKLAVLSNKPQSTAETVVRELLGGWDWLAVGGHRDGVLKKPDPTAALSIARDAGVDPADCAFLGDSHVDMETALAAGMLPLGAAWGFRGREELSRAGCRLIYDSPADLCAAVQDSTPQRPT